MKLLQLQFVNEIMCLRQGRMHEIPHSLLVYAPFDYFMELGLSLNQLHSCALIPTSCVSFVLVFYMIK